MQGQVIAGRYRLLDLLGKGSMGSVWRAEYKHYNTTVAVKIMHGEMACDDEARGRFLREAKIASTLKSPYLTQVVDFGNLGEDPEDGVFMVLEHLEGISLHQRIKTMGRLPLQETYRWVSNVCAGMSLAHQHGLVHRDLKPANIFLTYAQGTQIAKVLDFGVAKAPDALSMTAMDPTRTGVIVGSPYYMSPEQARGVRDIDHRSDLWSIGVVAFECLSGSRPIGGKVLADIMVNVLIEPIPAMSSVVPVPPAVDAWMARALARDRDNRFSTAEEMAYAFQAAMG